MAGHLPPAPDTPVTARVYLRGLERERETGQLHVEVTRAEYDAMRAETDAVQAWKDGHGVIDPPWAAGMHHLFGYNVVVKDDG